MINMQVLIDTNVVLDWLMTREPFHQNADYILAECMNGNIDGFLTSHMMTDMFYILRKEFDVPTRKQLLLLLCNNFRIIVENGETIQAVLENDVFEDLEDGLQMMCAKEYDLDYIITRDEGGFHSSPVTVIDPAAFITLYRKDAN